MESQKTIILGYSSRSRFAPLPNATDDDKLEYFSSKLNPYGRLLLALIQYLQQHTKYFDRINFVLTYEPDIIWPNGTLEGLFKKINHSEIDVGAKEESMDEHSINAVDFSYPYKLEDFTFVTRKPEYKPHIFDIFQMFSLHVWLTIISVLTVMPVLSYAVLKRKYTFTKISFDVFGILMKQNSFIKLSHLVEKLLVYSWVVGAMLLCLSYDSVFLSFLSVPPITKIKHLSDLASAVESGDYHCISHPHWGRYLENSEREHVRIIAADILKNKLSYRLPFTNFLRESQNQNLAYIIWTRFLDILEAEEFFISEDRFEETMAAMMVRRDFCCKHLLDSFVHKMMASGLYMKHHNDGSFLSSMGWKSLFPDSETTNRKLTLTHLVPAFIFLLTGYFVSFIVLIVEIVSGRKKMNSININQKRKRREVYEENPV